jgi:hypothetical protein
MQSLDQLRDEVPSADMPKHNYSFPKPGWAETHIALTNIGSLLALLLLVFFRPGKFVSGASV